MSNIPMTRPEQMLAFHDGQFPGKSFAGLEGGRILFSNGTHFSVSADGGVTWGEPYEGLDENGDPLTLKNCSLVQLSGGAIGMATKRIRPGTSRLYESQMVFRRSEDEGRTWSPLTLMNHWMLAAHALNDTMIRTQSGRIMLPVYFGIGQGGFQEIKQLAVFEDMVCYQEEVRDPTRMAEVLNRVIEKAWLGCAPAQINVPRDYWTQVIDIELPQTVKLGRPSGSRESIANAAKPR